MASPVRRDARRYRRRILTIGAILFGLLFVVGAPMFVRSVQADLDERVPDELATAGYVGITAVFDGQDGVLSCADPLADPEGARDAAYEIWGVRSVELDRSCRVNSASDVSDATATTDSADTTSAKTASSTTVADTPPSTTTATDTTTPSTEPAFATVAAAIAGSPQLSLFSVLIQDAGLSAELSDPAADPVTVFAASDDAFEALPTDVLAELRGDEAALRSLLEHQMTAGALMSADFETGPLEMLDGASVDLDASVPSIGGVDISVVDIVAATGVVHVIDAVLLPDDFDVSPAPDLAPVEAVYDGAAISLDGTVATEAVRVTLVEAATAEGITVTDQLTVDPDTGIAAAAADEMARLITLLRTNLLNGAARYEGEQFFLRGTYLDDAARDATLAVTDELGVETQLMPPPAATEQEAVDLEAELNAFVADHPVLFEPSSAQITDDSRVVLDQLARLAAQFDGISITVQGHTDSDGDPNENMQLSQARAFAVMQALIERGVPEASLSFEGFGSEQPILVDGREDKAASRRVEFAVEVTS